MPFFKWDGNNHNTVQGQFWIYLAVTIPLTLVVMAFSFLWVWWSQRRERSQAKSDVNVEEGFSPNSNLVWTENAVKSQTRSHSIPAPSKHVTWSSTAHTISWLPARHPRSLEPKTSIYSRFIWRYRSEAIENMRFVRTMGELVCWFSCTLPLFCHIL